MTYSTDPKKDTKPVPKKEEEKKAEENQQRTDPNITELKGLTDPKEPLEVKGTDNPF